MGSQSPLSGPKTVIHRRCWCRRVSSHGLENKMTSRKRGKRTFGEKRNGREWGSSSTITPWHWEVPGRENCPLSHCFYNTYSVDEHHWEFSLGVEEGCVESRSTCNPAVTAFIHSSSSMLCLPWARPETRGMPSAPLTRRGTYEWCSQQRNVVRKMQMCYHQGSHLPPCFRCRTRANPWEWHFWSLSTRSWALLRKEDNDEHAKLWKGTKHRSLGQCLLPFRSHLPAVGTHILSAPWLSVLQSYVLLRGEVHWRDVILASPLD